MLQVKFLLVGLLLAAGFVGYKWLDDLPGIPPVRLPEPLQAGLSEAPDTAARGALVEPFALDDNEEHTNYGGDDATVAVLPALNDSDGWLREQMTDTALPWLAETELVRTSATVLERAARGEVPRKLLEFLAPAGKFAVTTNRGKVTVDAASYARYDGFVASLTALAPARAAQMFGVIEPLLAEALRELGGDASGNVASPRELAYTALGVALATPVSATDAPLVRPKVIYKYADDSFEDLLPLQKQLLRMGPDNLQKLRFWLEDFGVALTPGLMPAPATLPAEQPEASSEGPFVSSDG